jgi:hypothetical protein
MNPANQLLTKNVGTILIMVDHTLIRGLILQISCGASKLQTIEACKVTLFTFRAPGLNARGRSKQFVSRSKRTTVRATACS